jgi:spermidine/putrescine transport system substrate-binding protein
MLKSTRIASLLLALSLFLAACGGSASTPPPADSGSSNPEPTSSEASTGESTEGEAAADGVDRSQLSSTLHFYNWADYIDETILDKFQEEYGVQVIVDVFDNNEDMIAKVRTGSSGYDIVGPSDYAVDIMVKDGLLAKLDKSLLSNMQYLKPDQLDLYFDPGNEYSLPYNQGVTGIAYLKSKFDTPPDSWSIFFDPAQAEAIAAKGGFAMLDDERETPGAALRYIGKSFNSTDPADLAQVEEILKTQKPFVSSYDSSSIGRKLASEEIIAAHSYNSVALQARLGLSDEFPGNEDVAFFVPKEGGAIWQDNLAILADSPNAYTAHVFLNYLMRPDIAAINAEYILGITPNAEAEKLLPAEIQELNQQGFSADAEVLERVEWIERNEESSVFTDLWTAVKGE